MLSVQRWHRVLVKFPFLYWEGPVHAGCARTLGDNGCRHVGGCLLPWLLRDLPCGQQQTHVQQVLRLTHPHSWEPIGALPGDDPVSCLSAQCTSVRTHHNGCYTPCTPFLCFSGTVFWMDQLLLQSLKRLKGHLNNQGAQHSVDWLWQAMDEGG